MGDSLSYLDNLLWKPKKISKIHADESDWLESTEFKRKSGDREGGSQSRPWDMTIPLKLF